MKSTDFILAKRYARALDGLSTTAAQAQEVCQALIEAAAYLRQVAGYMQDPAVACKDKIAFVQQLFGKESIIANFIAALLQAKRYYLLEVCVQEVSHLVDIRQGIVRGQVQTAYALTAEQQKKVEEALSQFMGKKVQASFTVQTQLLGGLRVRIDDTLIDGTIKRRFEKLQEELIQ